MHTLYDLLGALPRDDAEELRAAFRRAVKGAHPDLNPGDPDAGERFREILRANEILGDEEQRAAYDHLLDLAEQEQSRQATARTMYNVATAALVLVIVAAGGVGGYFTHQNMPEISGRLKQIAAIATASPGDFAGYTPAPAPADTRLQQAAASDARAEASPAEFNAAETKVAETNAGETRTGETRAQTASVEPPASDKPGKTDAASVLADAASPQADPDSAPRTNAGSPLEIAPGDAKVFRERGIFAYRSGDLDGAVAEFDRAIQLDPKFSAAYVDRGIVLYRMQKFERAFADIAHAKRIEKTRRTRAAQPDTKRKTAAAMGLLPPFVQRRTAKLE
jgi:tetratricopeptide (TPR) repeat protein